MNTMNTTNTLKLKVCGMADANSIAEVVDLQPDFIGFIFYPKSPRYLSDDAERQAQINAIPTRIAKVGVFVNESIELIRQRAEQYALDYIQLHGDETPEFAEQIKAQTVNGKALKVIKVFRVSNTLSEQLGDYQGIADYLLFDTATAQYGGSGEHFDWRILQGYDIETPFLLSGGVELADLPAIQQLAIPQLVGIDVNSRFEVEAGKKDLLKLQQLQRVMRNGA